MSGALAIMVKTPGHSQIKSRLAAGLGKPLAEEFHRLAAAAVASVAMQARDTLGIQVYWAVAEADAQSHWTDLPVIAQGAGGLGQRMAQVQAQLVARHGSGVLIGADSPQLSVELLAQALTWIDATPPRLALGPAHDGGFWLFGANLAPPLQPWESVEYSAADTAQSLRESMAKLGAWRLLPSLGDVDTVDDLPGLARALDALDAATPAQTTLRAWVHERLSVGTPRVSSIQDAVRA